MNVSEVLASRKPRKTTVGLLLDGDLAYQLAEARRVLSTTDEFGDTIAGPRSTAEARVRELEAAAKQAQTVFTLQAIGRDRLAEIKRSFPPTDEQWERWNTLTQANPLAQPPEFDIVGAMPTLLAESLVDPSATVEEAAQLWDVLSDGEAGQLGAALWDVNMEASSVPLSAGSTAPMAAGVQNSTT